MLTYNEARELMAKARNGRKKLENNTYLETRQLLDGKPVAYTPYPAYAVRLHNTDIVTLHPDDSYTLDSGGSRTVTTKDRINHYAPGSIASDRGSWYYYPHRDTRHDWSVRYPFADGMRVTADGTVTGAGIDETAIRRKILKQIKTYVDGFAAHVVELGHLEEPGSGDCWGCLMTVQAEKKTGTAPWGQDAVTKPGADMPFGIDHIFSHFEESYYVPSLLWRAMQAHGDPSFCWRLADARVGQKDASMVRNDLRRYFKKLMPALVEYARGQAATRKAA